MIIYHSTQSDYYFLYLILLGKKTRKKHPNTKFLPIFNGRNKSEIDFLALSKRVFFQYPRKIRRYRRKTSGSGWRSSCGRGAEVRPELSRRLESEARPSSGWFSKRNISGKQCGSIISKSEVIIQNSEKNGASVVVKLASNLIVAGSNFVCVS